jgi:hypothetical protein
MKTKKENKGENKRELKYETLWRSELPSIIKMLRDAKDKTQFKIFSESEFTKIGKRTVSNHKFNLEFQDGKYKGSNAVAEGLGKVLEDPSSKVKKIINNGHYKITMDKRFIYCLTITKV